MLVTPAVQQLRRAEIELGQIEARGDLRESFLHAHMAALRAGSAVLAIRPAPLPGRRRRCVRSVWEQLAECGSQWESWAAYFSQGAVIRAAIETDRTVSLTAERVDELVGAATDFVAAVTCAVEHASLVALSGELTADAASVHVTGGRAMAS